MQGAGTCAALQSAVLVLWRIGCGRRDRDRFTVTASISLTIPTGACWWAWTQARPDEPAPSRRVNSCHPRELRNRPACLLVRCACFPFNGSGPLHTHARRPRDPRCRAERYQRRPPILLRTSKRFRYRPRVRINTVGRTSTAKRRPHLVRGPHKGQGLVAGPFRAGFAVGANENLSLGR